MAGPKNIDVGEIISGGLLTQALLVWFLESKNLISREEVAEWLREYLASVDPSAEGDLYEPTRRVIRMVEIDKLESLH